MQIEIADIRHDGRSSTAVGTPDFDFGAGAARSASVHRRTKLVGMRIRGFVHVDALLFLFVAEPVVPTNVRRGTSAMTLNNGRNDLFFIPFRALCPAGTHE